jgi:hypothetical protein
MKKIGDYTVSGQTTGETTKRIQLFDGKYDTGYRITSFEVYPDTTIDPSNNSCKLVTKDEGTGGAVWNWGSNTEIAWSFAKIGSGTSQLSDDRYSVVDPENMVVEDLYVIAYSSDGSDQKINYLIKMEKYKFATWDGAAIMVKNQSQNVE